jgi:hypothetical protein
MSTVPVSRFSAARWVVDNFLEPLNGHLDVSEDQGLLHGGEDVFEYAVHGCPFCTIDGVGGSVPVGLYEDACSSLSRQTFGGRLVGAAVNCSAHHLAEVLVFDDTIIGEVCLLPIVL